jgi:hypothetical protein
VVAANLLEAVGLAPLGDGDILAVDDSLLLQWEVGRWVVRLALLFWVSWDRQGQKGTRSNHYLALAVAPPLDESLLGTLLDSFGGGRLGLYSSSSIESISNAVDFWFLDIASPRELVRYMEKTFGS